MCDEWMPALTLTVPREIFQRLPRHPGYAYEYVAGQVWLTPRPRFYHALLDLDRLPAIASLPRGVSIDPMSDDHIADLEHLFADAFSRQQPFAGLEADERHKAARQALAKVRTGGDGPWMAQASLVALEKQVPVGAIFVTLLPDADPSDWDSFHWGETPPPDWRDRGVGRPHLTWIFVGPWHVGRGTGTALLHAAGAVLRQMGYRRLASTFLLGNESSMLWHWRNGFELQTYPASRRRWDQQDK